MIDPTDFVALGEVTEPLRDPAYFARVFVEMGAPTWPNGCHIGPINAQMTLWEAGTLRAASNAA